MRARATKTRAVAARAGAATLFAVSAVVLAPGCADDPAGLGGFESPAATNVDVAYSFDPNDKRQIVAFADNVFVGRVVGQAGRAAKATSRPGTQIPQTQYTVRVTRNIKGRLRGLVPVNQFGGSVDEGPRPRRTATAQPRVELWEGDPLLEPGDVVLLATRRDAATGWHTIVAQPFADRRIRSRAEGDRLVRAFTEARRARRPK